jgi:hypothetical protein
MFHVVPFPGRNKGDPLHSSLAFLGVFWVVAIVIVLFILYFSGMPAA